jgi:hypothetical protein
LGDEVASVESRAMLIAAIVGIGIFTCNIQMWTPLQQWYWVQYLNTKSFPTARGDYKLLTTVDAHGKQLMAVDADVVPGLMQGWPPFPLDHDRLFYAMHYGQWKVIPGQAGLPTPEQSKVYT